MSLYEVVLHQESRVTAPAGREAEITKKIITFISSLTLLALSGVAIAQSKLPVAQSHTTCDAFNKLLDKEGESVAMTSLAKIASAYKYHDDYPDGWNRNTAALVEEQLCLKPYPTKPIHTASYPSLSPAEVKAFASALGFKTVDAK